MSTLIRHLGVRLTYPQPHDSASTRWYVMIWDALLSDSGSSIEQGAWTVTGPDDELTVEDEEIDVEVVVDGITYQHGCRVLLKGGSDGAKYIVTCTITTSTGEIIPRSFYLRIGDQ